MLAGTAVDAKINIFVLTMDQMTVNVKGVASSDDPTENSYPTLQFPFALWRVLGE